MGSETVLVTGAAGTVGGYLVRELVDRGHRVIAHDRPGARFELALPSGAVVEERTGDLRRLAACVDAVRGATAVVHAAAALDLSLPEADLMAINRDAVALLYQAARAAGARRFVFLSSGSIYDKGARGDQAAAADRASPPSGAGSGAGAPITEERPIAPSTAYERSKAQAEAYLLARPRTQTEVVVLRPTMIYGPRARFLAAKLATLPPLLALAFGKVPRLRGGPVCNWVHAEDVARAAAFVLDEPRAAWQAFNVADETPLSLGEVLEAITACYGLPFGAEVPYPMALLSRLGPALADSRVVRGLVSGTTTRLWRHLAGRLGFTPAVDASIDRETFLYAGVQAVFDTGRLQALGFRVKWRSLREGYPGVMRWFQQQGWLPAVAGGLPPAGPWAVRFAETMDGSWQPGAGADRQRLRFEVTADSASLLGLLRTGELALHGVLDAAGLASARPCAGTLELRPLSSPHALRYRLGFAGDDGHGYQFVGEKRLALHQLVDAMTTLPGRLLDERGDEVGRCLLRFDLRRQLLPFLRSFSLQPGAPTTALPAPSPALQN